MAERFQAASGVSTCSAGRSASRAEDRRVAERGQDGVVAGQRPVDGGGAGRGVVVEAQGQGDQDREHGSVSLPWFVGRPDNLPGTGCPAPSSFRAPPPTGLARRRRPDYDPAAIAGRDGRGRRNLRPSPEPDGPRWRSPRTTSGHRPVSTGRRGSSSPSVWHYAWLAMPWTFPSGGTSRSSPSTSSAAATSTCSGRWTTARSARRCSSGSS